MEKNFAFDINWLKIRIWDPKDLWSNAIYLVSLDPAGPYPKFVKTRSDVGGRKSIPIREEAAIGRCRHQVFTSKCLEPRLNFLILYRCPI